MNLKCLDGEALIVRTKGLVKEERLKTLQVIEHLQEIYDRRLHLARGFRSLHEFLVREIGYDDGSAHRRISAMRLVVDLPEAKLAIAEGKLSLLAEFRQLSRISEDREAIKAALRMGIKKLKDSTKASPAKLHLTEAVPRGVLPKAESRRPSAEVERQAWVRDQGRCRFTANDRRCTATQHLEIDHEVPWAFGGETRLENLRLLCRAHNRYLGLKVS